MARKHVSMFSTAFLIAAIVMIVGTAFSAIGALGATDTTSPTITAVSTSNNEQQVALSGQVSMRFSEQVNPATVNTNTFLMAQRTTPESGSPSASYRSLPINGVVASDGYTATFTPTSPLSPNQIYGNVFTVTLTSGIKDFAGNALARDYVWSFTTGNDPFNTGRTTFQLDQSQNLNAVPAPVPAPVTPVQSPAPAQAEAANSTFPWLLVIVGVLVFLAVLAIFAFPVRNTHRKTAAAKSPAAVSSDPFGDVYPVIELEGIGPEYNARLQAMGITNTHQLWKADAEKVAKQTGAPLLTVHNWQDMAELSSVRGIGPQHAELLERSGIHTVEQLRKADPDELLSLVRKKQESLKVNIEGNRPSHATIEHWIEEARGKKGSPATVKHWAEEVHGGHRGSPA